MKNIKSKIAESLKEIFQESTIHAIPRIIKSQLKLNKLIWFLCFLVSARKSNVLAINVYYSKLSYTEISQ